MKSLVFICGALRSGSTMVHLMLDNHPNIDNPGEFDFLFDEVRDDGSFPEVSAFHEWLELDRIFKSHHLKVDKSLGVRDLLRSFVDQLRQDGNVLALNVHRNFHRIPFVFPEADYIHLIRDPRDVARSSIGMGWAGNVYYGVNHWLATEASWLQLAPLIKSGFYTLRYENLVRHYSSELQTLCAFLDVPFSLEMLDYTNNSTYTAPDIKLIEQWKRNYSPEELNCVEFKAKDLLVKNGYETAGRPDFKLSLMQKTKLKFSDVMYRNKFFIRRFGLGLYLQKKISRIFNIKPVYKYTVLQCAEFEKRHLK